MSCSPRLPSAVSRSSQERRARYEPRWREALSEFSEAELLAAAAVLDRLRLLFDDIADE